MLKGSNKKIAILAILVIAVIGIISGPIKKSIEIRKAHQGEMMFYVIDMNEIENEKIKKWYMKNYQEKGIHTLDIENEKYILLSAGEQDIENIDIKIESVDGYEDNVMINGRVEIPKTEIESGLAYPHKVLRINEDPRKVSLGTLNLYDPYRDIKNVEATSIDLAILKEVNENEAKIISFNEDYKNQEFKLSNTALNQLQESDIKIGEVIGLEINKDDKSGYMTIENLSKVKNITQPVYVSKIDKENKIVKAKLFQEEIDIKYSEEINNDIQDLSDENYYLLLFENMEDGLYIKNINSI